MMKTLPQPRSWAVPPVRLCLDDLAALYRCFRELSSEVVLSTHQHEFDSLDDLPKYEDDVLTTFSITAREPYMTLELRPDEGRLLISDDSAPQRGVFEKARALLMQRRQRGVWLTRNSFLAGIATGLVVVLVGAAALAKSLPFVAATAILAVGCSAWSWYVVGPGARRHTLTSM